MKTSIKVDFLRTLTVEPSELSVGGVVFSAYLGGVHMGGQTATTEQCAALIGAIQAALGNKAAA